MINKIRGQSSSCLAIVKMMLVKKTIRLSEEIYRSNNQDSSPPLQWRAARRRLIKGPRRAMRIPMAKREVRIRKAIRSDLPACSPK